MKRLNSTEREEYEDTVSSLSIWFQIPIEEVPEYPLKKLLQFILDHKSMEIQHRENKCPEEADFMVRQIEDVVHFILIRFGEEKPRKTRTMKPPKIIDEFCLLE